MKIAIPTADGLLCAHFGHCQAFTFIDIDPLKGEIISTETAIPPAHEPGILPRWLKEAGVTEVIAGGMGQRAQSFFNQYGIRVLVGAEPGAPEKIAQDYIAGRLVTGENICDH